MSVLHHALACAPAGAVALVLAFAGAPAEDFGNDFRCNPTPTSAACLTERELVRQTAWNEDSPGDWRVRDSSVSEPASLLLIGSALSALARVG